MGDEDGDEGLKLHEPHTLVVCYPLTGRAPRITGPNPPINPPLPIYIVKLPDCRLLARLQLADGLPGEVGVVAAKVAVGSGLLVALVATALEVKVAGHAAGAEVEGLVEAGEDLVVGDGAGAVGVDEHREGLGNANGVGQLDDAAPGKTGSHNGLGGLAHDVGTGAVDLGGVLAGEGAATVGTPATVGVNDDLAASEAGITVGATNHEAARGVEVEDGLVIEVLGGDDGLDHVLVEVGGDLVVGDILVVLGGDEDSVHALGDHGAVLVLVLDGNLGLAVGAEPGADAVLADLGQLVADLGGEHVGEGHELGGLIGGVAEHDALVAGANLLELLGAHAVDALADVGGLLLKVAEHLAVVAVEADVGGGEADLAAGLAHDLLVVDLSLGGDLTEYHHHAGLGAGLAGDLGLGVLLEASVEDGIGDLENTIEQRSARWLGRLIDRPGPRDAVIRAVACDCQPEH
mmetsp:Transcript_20976/g.66462  ORF Transcript_20976/g.66462 Transcript_20976/m.66462 type:complete len:461 (+) Transcript_20976:322-1704(+)